QPQFTPRATLAVTPSPELCQMRSLELSLAFASALASWSADAELFPECIAEYEARFLQWAGLSGQATTVVPPRRSDMSEQVWLEALFVSASSQLERCRAEGGRYWEGRLDMDQYALNSTPYQQAVCSICSPQSCNRSEVVFEILPRFMSHQLRLTGAAPLGADLGRPADGSAEAVELLRWADIGIDFALSGADGCGTTSLFRNLRRHARIAFTNNSTMGKQDEDFRLVSSRKTLPTRCMVEEFREKRLSVLSGRRHLLGHSCAILWSMPIARQALASIPGLKVIVVLCDPVGRFEKEVLEKVGQRPASTWFALPELRSPDAKAWRWQRFARHLNDLRRLFGERLLLIHQASLRSQPRETFNAIADFLGRGPFQRGSSFSGTTRTADT
ncbi:unnamed protein product, partial [Polarella glacialis]